MGRALFIWIIHEKINNLITLKDQASLALANSDARRALEGVSDLPTLRWNLVGGGHRIQLIHLLTRLAYNVPDHYVCEHCLYLHRADKKEGHARDVAVAQAEAATQSESGLELRLAHPHPTLAPPCRRRHVEPGSWTGDHISPAVAVLPMTEYQHRVISAYKKNMHTFVGGLSPFTKRAPFSGLAHRDVYLLLKRVRLLINRKRALRSRGAGKSEIADDAEFRGLLKKVHRALKPFKAQMPFAPRTARPVSSSSLSSLSSSPSYSPDTKLKYTFTPRIVLGGTDEYEPDYPYCPKGSGEKGKPRFLLKTVVEFPHAAAGDAELAICPHQMLNHRHWPQWERDRARATRQQRPYLDRNYRTAWKNGEPGPPAPLHGPDIGHAEWHNHRPGWLNQGRENRDGTFSDWDRSLMQQMEEDVHYRNRQRMEHLYKIPARFRLHCHVNTMADIHADRLESDPHNDRPSFSVIDNTFYEYTYNQILPRTTYDGCCNYCMTDYTIEAVNKNMRISVWQDFGAEAPLTSLAWQLHLPGFFLQADNTNTVRTSLAMHPNTWQEQGPRQPHRNGRVWKLYETGRSGIWKRHNGVKKFAK